MNTKIFIWIGILMINVFIVSAQATSTGLFGSGGTRFLTVGIFIIIIFVIVDQVIKHFKGK